MKLLTIHNFYFLNFFTFLKLKTTQTCFLILHYNLFFLNKICIHTSSTSEQLQKCEK